MKAQNNLVYCGSFTTTQTGGNKKLLNYGATVYSDKQKELYNRLLVGFNAYTPEELYAMNSTKKNRIKRNFQKAQKLLNEFKKRRTIALLKDRVLTMIPNLKEDSLLGQLINCDIIDPKSINKFKFEELKITKEDRIKLFMDNGLLPSNFFSL